MSDCDRPARSEHAVWRRPRLVVLLCFVVAALVGADLGLKWWAFNAFPDRPVDIAATLEQAREQQQRHGGGLAGHVHLPGVTRDLAPNVLRIRLVLNLGAVFGMGQGKTWVFVVITIAAVVIIGYSFATTDRRAWLQQLLLAMVLAGALGNLYDRLVHGAVRDMLHLFPGVRLPFGWTWPGGNAEVYPWVFNLADVCLTIGIALIVLRAVWPRRRAGGSGASTSQ
jgi:signal peptidase II